MYHIIELENGQPMIFEQSARQIKSYLIANGRVFSKGYVFYLDNSLMGVCSDNLTEKHCIVENISGSNHISAFVHNNCIFVTTDNTLYEIDLNFNVVCKQEINLSLNNMTNATSGSENSLRNNSTNYNTSSYNVSNNNISNNNTSIPNTPRNNLPNNNTTNNYKAYNASYNSNSYKELVYNYNILKRDVEKLNNKYNELSNYVGSMQEQIRRLRLN